MTENHKPYLNVSIPCPYCADGFVSAEDRHARTRQDVCQHCAGTGFAPAGTGETAETSAAPLPPLAAEVVQSLRCAQEGAAAFNALPEAARTYALRTWGQAWCENEAGSLAQFAQLAVPDDVAEANLRPAVPQVPKSLVPPVHCYPARFTPVTEGPERGHYLVKFDDFPEARTFGRNMMEAVVRASDCLREAIRSRGIDGEELPPQRPSGYGEQMIYTVIL